MLGPTKDRDDTVPGDFKTCDELNNLIRNDNVVNYIKPKGWAGLAMYAKWQMIEWSKIILVETDIYKIGRKTKNCVGKRVMKINNWIKCIQDRVKWKEVVENSEIVPYDDDDDDNNNNNNNNNMYNNNNITFLIISRWILLRMGNISDKSCRENQNAHFMCNISSQKLCRLWDNMQKYGTHRWQYNKAHALCVLDI